jgi:predicted permease
MRVAALIATGLSADAARAQAFREFGDLDDARRYIGAVDRDIEAAERRSEYMRDLWQDLVYAVRKLRAAPAFTLAAVVTLALGVGANTAIFSVVNSVLLEPLPFPHADHLMRLRFTTRGQPDAGTPMDLVDNRTRAKSFDGFAVLEGSTANLSRDGGDAERVPAVRVSANWFDLLRIKPIVGRFFLPREDEAGAENVVVLSEQLWRRDFSADPNIVGKTVRVNSTAHTIIGVVAAEQRYPITAELWTTKRWEPGELSDNSRGARWLGFLARVKDDVDVVVANREVEQISVAMEKQFPEMFRERRARLMAVQDYLVGEVRKPLYLMLGAVAFVLLIACANVANLMLVRATAREGEMAIRTALGAGRGRLVRQLITEAVLLSLLGAALGIGVAKLGMTEFLSRVPSSLVVVGRASIDATTLGVTAIIALLTGVLFGALPATQVGKTGLANALRTGARGVRLRPSANRTKRAIVVAEVALAVTLLAGAGLLLHSFARLLSVDPGFRPQGVLSMKLALPGSTYDSTRIRAFMQSLEERARAIPGVSVVGIGSHLPLDNSSYGFTFKIRGRPVLRESDEPSAEVRTVSAGFFDALGMQVVRGRGISIDDRPGSRRVLVVNRAFAKKFFGNENPIGHEIELGWGEDPDGATREIVGVVGDVRSAALADAPEPFVYAPMTQTPFSSLSILVRTNVSPATLTTPLRNIVGALDREVPVYSVMTMEDRVASSVGSQKFYAMLITIFAGVALLLSAVGLYGVIAFAVSQRTHELGVRVALGATSDKISSMVIREGVALTAVGVVLGVLGAIVAGRVMATLLFDVKEHDPLTLISVVLTLGVVAVVASWLPARRASRVDPLVAMRGD